MPAIGVLTPDRDLMAVREKEPVDGYALIDHKVNTLVYPPVPSFIKLTQRKKPKCW